MNAWTVKSCRACLLQDNVCNMYDLAVPEVLQMYIEASNVMVTIKAKSTNPQHLCNMCYRLCEMIEGFRERCQETEKKLKRQAKMINRMSGGPKRPIAITTATPDAPVKTEMEDENEEQEETEDGLGGVEYGGMEEVVESGNDHDESLEPIMTHWEEDDEGDSPKRRKKTRGGDIEATYAALKQKIESNDFVWGPGPNEVGVWKHFLRDQISKKYGKCNVEGCERIICCSNGSTTSMRTHLMKTHGIELSSRIKNFAMFSP